MSIADDAYLVVDTETTGVNSQVDRVVEIGVVLLRDGKIEDTWESIINPGIPIPPEASAIHHLTDEDVSKSPSIESITEHLQSLVGNVTAIAAHNAEFDRSFLPMIAKQPWICTYRLSRHLWPNAPAYGNQVLRYWLKLKVDVAGKNMHRALPDALVTAKVLGAGIELYLKNGEKDSLKAMIDYIDSPIIIQKMPFGKHRGKLLSEIPEDYFRWALGNILDMDLDLKWSIENVLAKRK
ncbi:MAG: DUF3820 family protein [Candidatus Micrarchaeota archaeon]